MSGPLVVKRTAERQDAQCLLLLQFVTLGHKLVVGLVVATTITLILNTNDLGLHPQSQGIIIVQVGTKSIKNCHDIPLWIITNIRQ